MVSVRENRAAAARFIGAGLPILIASGKTKRPIIKGWQNRDDKLSKKQRDELRQDFIDEHGFEPVHVGSTINPKVVDKLFEDHPDSVAGLVCRHAGVVVIDCDRKNVSDGPEQMFAFLTQNDIDLTHVPQIRSGSSGYHLYFANPDAVPSGKIKQFDVDIKGAGGYVVAPGSIRSDGKSYIPVDGTPDLVAAIKAKTIPPLPACVIGLMHKADSSGDADEDIRKTIADLNGTPEADLIPFDFEALKAKDEDFRQAVDEPGADCSENRWKAASALYREFGPRGFTAPHLRAFFDEMDGAGVFVAHNPGQGEYGLRSIARDYWRSRGNPNTTGEAFGTVDDADSYGQDEPPPEIQAKIKAKTPLIEFGSDLLQGDDEPPIFVVDDLIEAATLFVLYGHPGAGKSALVLDLSCHVACGRPWASRPVQQGYVLYVTVEGPAGTKRRIKAWAKRQAANQHSVDLSRLAIIRQPVDMFGSDGGMLAIIKAVQKLPEACVLIVFDTMRQVMVGGDENAPADVGVFTTRCAKIRDATGAAVGFVHHTGKDRTRGAAGTTAIIGNVDVELFTEKEKPAHTYATLRGGKLRDGFMPRPIIYDLEAEVVATKANGRPVTAVVAVVRDEEAASTTGAAFGAVDEDQDMAQVENMTPTSRADLKEKVVAAGKPDNRTARAEQIVAAARVLSILDDTFSGQDLLGQVNVIRKQAGQEQLGDSTVNGLRRQLVFENVLISLGENRHAKYRLNL